MGWLSRFTLLLFVILVSSGAVLADGNGGKKDSGKPRQPINFIVGPVTKTHDNSNKGGGGRPQNNGHDSHHK